MTAKKQYDALSVLFIILCSLIIGLLLGKVIYTETETAWTYCTLILNSVALVLNLI